MHALCMNVTVSFFTGIDVRAADLYVSEKIRNANFIYRGKRFDRNGKWFNTGVQALGGALCKNCTAQ